MTAFYIGESCCKNATQGRKNANYAEQIYTCGKRWKNHGNFTSLFLIKFSFANYAFSD